MKFILFCLYFTHALCHMFNSVQLFGFKVLTVVAMKSNIIWNVTPCSLIEIHWCFRRTCCLQFHSRRVSQANNHISKKQVESTAIAICFLLVWLFASLIPWPWRWRQYVPLKHRWTLTGIHSVMSHKIVLFMSILLCYDNFHFECWSKAGALKHGHTLKYY
jgi:hypothetical protein